MPSSKEPKKKADLPAPTLQTFINLFDKICYRHSDRTLFDDFLTMCLCAASLGKYEDEYLKVIKQYSKEEAEDLCKLFATLIMLSDNDGEGKNDVLGEFYMERLSHGHNGEFYTPMVVCDMMARMTIDGVRYFPDIADPACGSGRTLLAAAKITGMHNMFYGFDITNTAVKMCTLNMWMNGLPSFIVHGDSLAMKAYGGYSVQFKFQNGMMAPEVTKLNAEQAQTLMGRLPDRPVKPVGPLPEVSTKTGKEQLLLF